MGMEAWHFFLWGLWSFKRSIFICLNDFPNPLHLYDSLSGERDSLTWLSNSFLCQMAFKVRKLLNIIHLNRSGFNLNPFPLALPLSLDGAKETFVMELHFRTFQIIQDSVLQPSFLWAKGFQFLQYFKNVAHFLIWFIIASITAPRFIVGNWRKKHSSGTSLFFASLLCNGTSFD